MSAAKKDIRTVSVTQGDITYDSDMPMGVMKKLMTAGKDGDLEVMEEALGALIQTWPFDGEPGDIEAWDSLRRSQFVEILDAVMDDFNKLGEA